MVPKRQHGGNQHPGSHFPHSSMACHIFYCINAARKSVDFIHSVVLKNQSKRPWLWAREVVQQAKMLASKPEDLSLISGTQMVER